MVKGHLYFRKVGSQLSRNGYKDIDNFHDYKPAKRNWTGFISSSWNFIRLHSAIGLNQQA